MPWSRHDLFFRCNASAARRLAHRIKRVGLLAMAGMSVTTANIAMTRVAHAQSFTPIGPRYSGEVIISERIVSPAPERLPAPKQSTSRSSSPTPQQPTLSIAGQEPVSLSDGGKASDLSIADQTPIFALGNDVWQRMLDLERENADLQAQLEYERKLASYIERSEIHLINQGEKIVELQEKLKQLQQKGIATSKEKDKALEKAGEQIRQLASRNRDFEQKIRDLQRDLRMATESGNQSSSSLEQPERKVATKPAPQRSAKLRPAKQRTERSVKAELPGTITLPPPLGIAVPDATKPDEEADADAEAEADGEPVGSVALAVTPIGFEISDGLVQPIKSPESEGNEVKTEPAAGEGLQGGALGPLGKTESLSQ